MALADNLVAYFNLDEPNDFDAAVVDYHNNINANDMRDVHGNVGADPTGLPDSAGNRVHDGAGSNEEYFDCINDAGDYYNTSTGPFSLSLWVIISEFAQHRHFVTRWNNLNAAEQEWRVAVNGSTRKFFLSLRNNAGGAGSISPYDVTACSGTLYFITTGYDPDSDVLWMSFNGESKYTGAGPGDHVSISKLNFFTLASIYNGNDDQTTLNGRLARVGFWEKVLNDTENAQLYKSGVGLKYPFSVPTVGVVPDDGSLGPGGRSKIYMPPFNPLV